MTKSIFTKEFNPPEELLLPVENIVIFPTDRKYSNEDYEAVIMSSDFLHIWGDDAWPDNNFSPEDNYNDLACHIEDNLSHKAYGYMIFNIQKNKCLGSIYINPLDLWPKYHDLLEGVDPREQFDARIDYWTRSDEPELDKILLPRLIEWFRDVWKISAVVVSKPGFTIRNKVIKEMNLTPVASFLSKEEKIKMTMYKLS